jgi:HK97 gp10 family phage protein
MRQAFKTEIERAVKETGNEVVNEARRIVPVRTGRLRDSLKVGKAIKDLLSDPARLEVVISSDAPYWMFVEYGTRRMAARPYIRPAVEWGKNYLVERVGDAIHKVTISKATYKPWED